MKKQKSTWEYIFALSKQKLDLPITGQFIVMGRKGRALQLKEIATKKLYLVHPDYIVPSATHELNKEVVTSTQAERERRVEESVGDSPTSIMQQRAKT